MDWLNQRQKVVAGNIAHADAPNYREGEAPRRPRGPPHAGSYQVSLIKTHRDRAGAGGLKRNGRLWFKP